MCIRDRVGCERAHRGGWLVVDAALLLVDTALLLLVTSAIPTVFEASHERLLVRLGTLARVTRLACPPRMLVLTHRSVLTDSTQLDLGRLGRRDRIDAITPAKTPKVKLGAVGEDGSVREHEHAGRTGKTRHAGKGAKSNKQTLMRRLEDRWDRRRHEQQ